MLTMFSYNLLSNRSIITGMRTAVWFDIKRTPSIGPTKPKSIGRMSSSLIRIYMLLVSEARMCIVYRAVDILLRYFVSGDAVN